MTVDVPPRTIVVGNPAAHLYWEAPGDGEATYHVRTGALWWRNDQVIARGRLRPLDDGAQGDQYVRDGFASSIVGVNRLLLGRLLHTIPFGTGYLPRHATGDYQRLA